MRRILPAFAALSGILLLCLPACSTMYTLGEGKRYLYGGTRENVVAFVPQKDRIDPMVGVRPVMAVIDPAFLFTLRPAYDYPGDPYGNLRRTVAFLDFPCSLAFDTVLVPITLPLQIIKGDR